MPRRPVALLLALAWALLPGGALAGQEGAPRGGGVGLKLSGRLHAQFRSSSVPGAGSDLLVRRARFTAELSLNRYVSARIQPEFAGGGPALEDAFVRFRTGRGLSIAVGQLKRAFDLVELDSSVDLSTIERDGRIPGLDACPGVGAVCSYSRFARELEYGARDIGVELRARSGPLRFLGTVTHGAGPNRRDENDARSFAARVSYAVNDGLSLAGGVSTHDYDVDGETVYARAWNLDLKLGDWRDGLHVEAGVMGGDNWRVPGSPDFFTWQVTATWYRELAADGGLSGVEPLLRVSRGDPDTAAAEDGGLLVTPGAMFYVCGRNKVGFNLDVYASESGRTEASLKVQTFLFF